MRLLQHDRALLLLLAHLLVTQAIDTGTREGERTAERRPLLAPWWRTVEDGDRLLFEHAGEVVELRGRAVQAFLPVLVPLLDGRHTLREIVNVLGDAAETPVTKALALLDDHGLLVEGPPVEADDATACYVAAVCWTTPAEASAALSGSRVAVLGAAPAATEVAGLLGTAGVATTCAELTDVPSERADLVVAAPAPDEVPRLADVNELRLADGTPWLALLPADGRFASVGPLYVPDQTACHVCWLLRRGSTSGYEVDFSLLERQPVRAPMPAATSTVVAGLAALLCLRWLGAHDPTLPGIMYALEVQGALGLTRHRVLRVPRCPACSAVTPLPSPWFREPDAGARRQTGDTRR